MTKKVLLIVLVVIIVLFLFGSGFYWFQWRPTKIKHDCSWVKRHIEGKPERLAMTAQQIREKGMLKDCSNKPTIQPNAKDYLQQYYLKRGGSACEAENTIVIEKYSKPQKATPAKDIWVKATKEEYQFCLHDEGL